MKLKMREITLNEEDGLKDLFYLERTLAREYEEGLSSVCRKETENELSALQKLACEGREEVFSLWKKAKAERI